MIVSISLTAAGDKVRVVIVDRVIQRRFGAARIGMLRGEVEGDRKVLAWRRGEWQGESGTGRCRIKSCSTAARDMKHGRSPEAANTVVVEKGFT